MCESNSWVDKLHNETYSWITLTTESKGWENNKSYWQERKIYFKWNDVTSNWMRKIIDAIHLSTEWWKWWWCVNSTPDIQRKEEGKNCRGKGKRRWVLLEGADVTVALIWTVGLVWDVGLIWTVGLIWDVGLIWTVGLKWSVGLI